MHISIVYKNIILSKIIICIQFCVAFELDLRGHDEKSDFENSGIFRGLINFSAELDTILKLYLKQYRYSI